MGAGWYRKREASSKAREWVWDLQAVHRETHEL